MPEDPEIPSDAPLELPIDGELDLHTFRPRDVKDVVVDYLEACRARGILEVRVVHGKGIGQLRQTVHSVLVKLPFVAAFALAGPHYGGEGATMVKLIPGEGTTPRPLN
jgi:DNA-nicking Smr family endonuclease